MWKLVNYCSCKTNVALNYQNFRLRAPWSSDFFHKMRRDTIWKGVKLSVIPSAVMCAGWSWSGLSNRSQLQTCVFGKTVIGRYQWIRSRIIWTVIWNKTIMLWFKVTFLRFILSTPFSKLVVYQRKTINCTYIHASLTGKGVESVADKLLPCDSNSRSTNAPFLSSACYVKRSDCEQAELRGQAQHLSEYLFNGLKDDCRTADWKSTPWSCVGITLDRPQGEV